MKILITGGVRSGKSFHAESLLLAEPTVTYVAPSEAADPADDPEWASRVAAHQARRPAHWITVENPDLAAAVDDAEGAVLIDCLSTWLHTQIADLDGWEMIRAEWEPVLLDRLGAAADAIARYERTVVIVTNEVGMGVVPEHRSDRIFAELLGTVNRRIAQECDDVLLVVAGRTVPL